jgi:hypothetical protein
MKNQSSLSHQITCRHAICIEAEPNLGGSMLKNRRNFFLDEDQYTRLVKGGEGRGGEQDQEQPHLIPCSLVVALHSSISLFLIA